MIIRVHQEILEFGVTTIESEEPYKSVKENQLQKTCPHNHLHSKIQRAENNLCSNHYLDPAEVLEAPDKIMENEMKIFLM